MANDLTSTPMMMPPQQTPLQRSPMQQHNQQHQILQPLGSGASTNQNSAAMLGGLGMTTPLSTSHRMPAIQPFQQPPTLQATPMHQPFSPMQSQSHQQLNQLGSLGGPLGNQQSIQPPQSHTHQSLLPGSQQAFQSQVFQTPMQQTQQHQHQQQQQQQSLLPQRGDPLAMASETSKMQTPVMQSNLAADTPGQQQPLLSADTMISHPSVGHGTQQTNEVMNGGMISQQPTTFGGDQTASLKPPLSQSVVQSGEVHSSLALQIILHFDEYFAMLFMVGGSLLLIVKAALKTTSGFPPLNGIADFVMLCLLTIVQIARLTLASKGNKCVDYTPLVYSAMLSFPVALAYVFFLDWQTVVYSFDIVLCSMGLALLTAGTVLSVLVAVSFWSLQRKQD